MKYIFKNKEEQKQALKEFLDAQGAWTRKYRTENKDSVDEYIYYFAIESKVSLKEILENNRDTDLETLINDYRGRVKDSVLYETLVKHAEMEACGVMHVDNHIFQAPVGEVEDQVSGIAGNVNGKDVLCILAALTDGLTLDDQKEVARDLCEAYWDPEGSCSDCIYVNCDYDCWAAVVDCDAAREELESLVPHTVVVFRKFKTGGDVIALFPYEINYSDGACESYQRVGQHGAAHYSHVVSASVPAKPREYATLKKELEALGYKLDVRKRIDPRRLPKSNPPKLALAK